MAYAFIFGRNATGATSIGFSNANEKTVSRFELTVGDSIEYLIASHSAANSTVKLKGVIYADNAGEPGALIATTVERVGVDVAWNVLTFASAVALSPGFYWLGVIANTNLTANGMGTTGINRTNADTYSDGPANPFGTPTTATAERPIYAAKFEPDTPGKTSIAKAVTYSVLSPAGIASVAKAVAYAVLSTETTIGIAKAVAYAVLEPAPIGGTSRPVVFICT